MERIFPRSFRTNTRGTFSFRLRPSRTKHSSNIPPQISSRAELENPSPPPCTLRLILSGLIAAVFPIGSGGGREFNPGHIIGNTPHPHPLEKHAGFVCRARPTSLIYSRTILTCRGKEGGIDLCFPPYSTDEVGSRGKEKWVRGLMVAAALCRSFAVDRTHGPLFSFMLGRIDILKLRIS